MKKIKEQESDNRLVFEEINDNTIKVIDTKPLYIGYSPDIDDEVISFFPEQNKTLSLGDVLHEWRIKEFVFDKDKGNEIIIKGERI